MGADRAAEVRAELEELYGQWFAAIPRHDRTFFEHLLDDGWVYVNNHGELRGKREYLEYLETTVPRDAAPNRLTGLDVRIVGEVALALGCYVSAGGGTVEELRFTAVWVDRGGRWRALAHHSTTVAERSH